MNTVRTVRELRAAVARARGEGKRIGFVPTMGNLHDGHAALVEKAGQRVDFVVASIFVNPLQFGVNEDLASYPRTLEADQLKRQIAELNAKETERGLVVTLGDVLFETDKSELKGSAASNLDKLVAFLSSNPERSVQIEGHTDSVGNDDYNFSLSQRRAESVRHYLINRGIAANRMDASGKGESSPVASNSDATGRQMNRRVEVVIANPVVSAK